MLKNRHLIMRLADLKQEYLVLFYKRNPYYISNIYNNFDEYHL